MARPDRTGGNAPLRSKVTAALAALACAACCALPLLIGAGLLTGAGGALAEQVLGLLAAGAAGMWWLHRRRAAGCACGCRSGAVEGEGPRRARRRTRSPLFGGARWSVPPPVTPRRAAARSATPDDAWFRPIPM